MSSRVSDAGAYMVVARNGNHGSYDAWVLGAPGDGCYILSRRAGPQALLNEPENGLWSIPVALITYSLGG